MNFPIGLNPAILAVEKSYLAMVDKTTALPQLQETQNQENCHRIARTP
jgi:hypothetical protein